VRLALMAEPVVNITEKGIRKRRRIAVAMTIVSLVMAVALIPTGSPRWTRLVLFVPMAMAASAFFQVRKKTCVVLSVMGSRETDDGGYARMSTAQCEVVRRQAASIVAQGVLLAAVLTAAIWFV
jgi:hypothetical protein